MITTDDVQVAVVDYDVLDHDVPDDDLAETVRIHITSVEALPDDGEIGVAKRDALNDLRERQRRL